LQGPASAFLEKNGCTNQLVPVVHPLNEGDLSARQIEASPKDFVPSV
jgi:hypothetical protein